MDRPRFDGPPLAQPGAVLIVDDERINRVLLARQVEQMGHTTTAASNGEEALLHLRSYPCDLILLDVVMPVMDGMQLLEVVRNDDALRRVPVIVVSSSEESATAVQCIEAGAEDFLTKPFDTILLRARINACLEKKRLRDSEAAHVQQLLQLQQRLEDRNKELETANRKLAELALTDPLTGLPNRRHALEHLGRIWASASRHQRQIAALAIDVDHFKRINDTFGHDAGDAVLRQLGQRLRAAARSEEVVCRVGGEEFMVLVESQDAEGAVRCAERLRQAVAQFPAAHDGTAHSVTVSIGVSVRDASMTLPEQLLKRADQGLYKAKATGRNRVCLVV